MTANHEFLNMKVVIYNLVAKDGISVSTLCDTAELAMVIHTGFLNLEDLSGHQYFTETVECIVNALKNDNWSGSFAMLLLLIEILCMALARAYLSLPLTARAPLISQRMDRMAKELATRGYLPELLEMGFTWL